MEQYSWFTLYRVAMLEIDSSKVAERVALAREKLRQRMKMAGLSAAEQQALLDALNNLHVVEMTERSRSRGRGV